MGVEVSGCQRIRRLGGIVTTRHWMSAAALGLAAMYATGCAAPKADTSACAKASEQSLKAIGERLDVPGTLRFGQEVPSSRQGMTFVSAELHEPDHDEDEKGDIYTWAVTSEGDAADYVAVDTRAKSDSSW